MDFKHLLGFVVIALLLVPNVSALTARSCVDGNLRTNITQIDPRVEYVWVEPCGNGCIPIGGGRFTCATSSFFIPIELYVLFQVIAMVFFLLTLYAFYFTEDTNTTPFALLSMIFFFPMAIASYNMGGITFMLGASINFGLGMFSIAFLFISAMDHIPKKV